MDKNQQPDHFNFDRRKFLKLITAGCAAYSVAGRATAGTPSPAPVSGTQSMKQPKMKKPNILLILTDQHQFGAIGALGHPDVKTPNLDALAAQSLVFDSAYTPAPICGPARAALFTGCNAIETGIHVNWIPLPENLPLMTERLASAGYHNALVGKLHLSPVADMHGFHWRRLCDSPHDVYDPEEIEYNDYLPWAAAKLGMSVAELARRAGESEHISPKDPAFWQGWSWAPDEAQMTTWTGEEAVGFLKEYKDDAPFFLNVSFFGPHHPYALAEPWDSMVDPTTVTLPETLGQAPAGRPGGSRLADLDEARWRKMLATYYGHIAAIDLQIGRILDELRARGEWENTLIVFSSDHGDHMGDYSMLGKGTMRDTSVRIPMFLKPPGPAIARSDKHEAVNLLDLFPTFTDYATGAEGSAPPESLRAIVEGSPAWDNETFSTMCKADLSSGQVMCVRDRWKAVANLKDGAIAGVELYDRHAKHPDSNDLAGAPENAPVVAELKARIEEWIAGSRKALGT